MLAIIVASYIHFGTHMQLLASDVVDFEEDLKTMKRMHDYRMYPPRFTIEINGERATTPSRAKVEFTGVCRKLSTEVILPLPIQPPAHHKIAGMVCGKVLDL